MSLTIQLQIQSDDISAARATLVSALNTQKRMLSQSVEKTQNNIYTFEKKYGLSTKELLQQESSGTIHDDNLELIEWRGEIRMWQRLESELELANFRLMIDD